MQKKSLSVGWGLLSWERAKRGGRLRERDRVRSGGGGGQSSCRVLAKGRRPPETWNIISTTRIGENRNIFNTTILREIVCLPQNPDYCEMCDSHTRCDWGQTITKQPFSLSPFPPLRLASTTSTDQKASIFFSVKAREPEGRGSPLWIRNRFFCGKGEEGGGKACARKKNYSEFPRKNPFYSLCQSAKKCV